MSGSSVDKDLLVAMFKEEWRLHRSFVGAMGSSFFPVMIFVFSLVLAITAPVILKNIQVPTILLLLHVAALLYGLFVGALAKIGEQVMTRRLGQVNMLLQISQSQPISFKRVMAAFYIKDAIFYLLYSLIPLVGGIAVAAPLAHVSYGGVALLFLTMFLTFMMGMSLSFLLSAMATRSVPATGVMALALLVFFLGIWPLGVIPPGLFIMPLGFWEWHNILSLLVPACLMLLMSWGAVSLMRERYEVMSERYDEALLGTEESFAFTGGMKTLMAKEWLELRRSGSLSPVITGFLGPLLGIYMLLWILQSGMGLEIPINAVFYASMVGFLGVMTYSWLTNIEFNGFLNVQPVDVNMVIQAKLILYFLLTSGISIAYVIIIAFVSGDMDLIPVAVLVAAATNMYVVAVTAYLTGLKTNTMLFDPKVNARFAGSVIPPLILLVILSFWVRKASLLTMGLLAVISIVLMVAAWAIMRMVGPKWRAEPFGI